MPKVVITQENIESVLKIVRMWKGKLTWTLLCDEVSRAFGIDSVERQSLASYKSIQQAYTKRKEELKAQKELEIKPYDNYSVEYLLSKIESLEDEVAFLRQQNQKFKERFVLWQYNAYLNGLRVERLDDVIDKLDKPIPTVNRR